MSAGTARGKGAAQRDRAAKPLVFLIAGEPSGDQLGARLMAALKRESKGRVRFAGVGGEQMAAEGLDSLFPISDLAVMGIVEVLPHLRTIYRRIRETVAAAKAARPAAVVTIDSPSFTLEVSQRLQGTGVPLIHYVAPSVWAWKPWRAKQMARYLDHLLALLPFEPPYFERHGLATTFVGHPAVEGAGARRGGAAALRARLGVPRAAPLLCLLPGSRPGEVRRHLPIFADAADRLCAEFPDLRIVVPTVPLVEDAVVAAVGGWAVPATVLPDAADKPAAFAAADVALAASGTVALELAVAGLPAVIAYRVAPLSGLIARALLSIQYVSLVNVVLGREVQPERLQGDCTGKKLAAATGRLMRDEAMRRVQLAGCREAAKALGLGGAAPSHKAARRVLALMTGKRPTARRKNA